MHAQLGNIIFQNLKSFDNLNKRNSATYAEHALLDSKPRLQRTGLGLEEITTTMRFHVSFCNPANEVNALRTFFINGEVLPLLWGNGILAGNYVITDLDENIEDTDPQGNVLSSLVNCTLKEYIINNRLQSEQDENRKKASAVGDKKPVAKKKVNPGTCQKIVCDIISKIDARSASINKTMLEKGGNNSPANNNAMRSNANAIKLLCADLITRGNDSKSCVYGYPDIKHQAQQTSDQAQFFLTELLATPAVFPIAANPASRLPNENNNLSMRVGILKRSAEPLIKQSITRK